MLAFAHVAGNEDVESWTWFLRRLGEAYPALRAAHGDALSKYVVLSDRQKGLIAAVRTELPRVHHFYCSRHL